MQKTKKNLNKRNDNDTTSYYEKLLTARKATVKTQKEKKQKTKKFK